MKTRTGLPFAMPDAHALLGRFDAVRARSLDLVAPLSAEDCALQSMPGASPAKWHLAHTTWFFEQFVLLPRADGWTPVDPRWQVLFNSYYESVGPQHARALRGMLSRPSLEEVFDYRARVDDALRGLIAARADDGEIATLIQMGLQHEQQHQELILTDIKHAFWLNPLLPAYAPVPEPPRGAARAMAFVAGREGVVEIGHAGDGFAFDNEGPRHRALLQPHALADRPVDNADFRAFIDDGGYRDARLWLSDGWAAVGREGWSRPQYWLEDDARELTLGGVRPIDPHAPVCHVSYYEADAYARWAGRRLPTEFEWEDAAARVALRGNFADSGALHPLADASDDAAAPRQMFGDVWEWTSSAYAAYPRYRPVSGALGEYNGKFMCGQYVLRGGSCATPHGHVRATYRNFFQPADRWQFMGIRLAEDA